MTSVLADTSRSGRIRFVLKDLRDFVESYRADNPGRRKETPHFRRFEYLEIMKRDKANLDIQWQDEALNAPQNGTPQALMKEILADLDEAMREFAAAATEIRK